MQCPICCEQKLLMALSSNCEHRFCQDCCFSHIKEKADRFTPIVCAYPNCDQKFDKESSLQLYQLLPAEVKDKIDAYVKYQFFSKNPNFKPCSVANCIGKINTKNKIKQCDLCSTKHCYKCLKQFHAGACIIDEHDRLMRLKKNQKCPTCGIWVQRKQGCDYIVCKCDTQFCFNCGSPYLEDPCRKKNIKTNQNNIKSSLKKIRIHRPHKQMGFLSKFLRLIGEIIKITIKLPLFLFLTVFISALGLAYIVSRIILHILFVPQLAMIRICAEQTHWCFKLFWFIVWPISIVGGVIFVIFEILLYPCLRNKYPHGTYEQYERDIYGFVQCYLGCIVSIFQMCAFQEFKLPKKAKQKSSFQVMDISSNNNLSAQPKK